VLLDVAYRQLDLKIVGMVPCNLFQAEKYRLQSGQIVDNLDLLVQTL
jgi:hypothetical protein